MVIMYAPRRAQKLEAGWACSERGCLAVIRTSYGTDIAQAPEIGADLPAVRLTQVRNDSVAKASRHTTPTQGEN